MCSAPTQHLQEHGSDWTLILAALEASCVLVHHLDACKPPSCNVNVNLYSASSQKIMPLMRSMCRVLFNKKRLHGTTKTVNLHVRFTQIVSEQVPCRWSSDSKGATAVRIELKLWNNE